jgi:hypothetical protein
MGAFLKQIPKATGGEHGGRPKIDGARSEPSNPTPTLAEIGITKKQSATAQKLADILKPEFRERITVAKTEGPGESFISQPAAASNLGVKCHDTFCLIT